MSTTRFDEIKALALDHYGTLFDKHAISELIEAEFPGHGLEVAQSWFLTTKEYCWLNGMMERHQTWDDDRVAGRGCGPVPRQGKIP